MKRMEETKEEMTEGLEEGEIQHSGFKRESDSKANGNMETSGSLSEATSATPVKLEKDSMRPRGSVSPGELSRSTKVEPTDVSHSECASGSCLGDHRHTVSERAGGARLGHNDSRHLCHTQVQGHGLGLQGPGLCLVTNSSLQIHPDSLSPLESPVSNFTVENFLSPSHMAAGGEIGAQAPSSSLSSRSSSLMSPHLLPYTRTSELYRSSTACGQGSSPPASSYSYHCGSVSGPSAPGYPPSSTPLISPGHGHQPSSSSLSGHHQHGVASMTNSNSGTSTNHGCSEENTSSPHATSHHHGGHSNHVSAHASSLHQASSSSSSVFSSMSQHKDFAYPRSNGWYMSPATSAELNPGPSDYSSFPGMSMREVFQNSASCQLAAFRSPTYKTSPASYYDCSKY